MEEAAMHLVSTSIDDGRIMLKSLIGSGSFAIVFLGLDQFSGEEYAIKTLFKQHLSPSQVKLQKKECVLMNKVKNHPNIVKLYKVVENDDHLFLVLEKCELDLYDAIVQKQGFPTKVVKEVFDQILDALIYCHSKHIFHRDIKPENILISTDFRVKITDFGLSTTESWSCEYGCGSLRYMAPECFGPNTSCGKAYSCPANDVWGVGVLLVNLLTGKNPWHEATMKDPIYSAYTTSNPSILKEQFGFSDEFDSLLGKIFHPIASKRIPLIHLRQEIMNIACFFENEEDASCIVDEGSFDSISRCASTAPKSEDAYPSTPSFGLCSDFATPSTGGPITPMQIPHNPNQVRPKAAAILRMEDDEALDQCYTPYDNLDTLLPSPAGQQDFFPKSTVMDGITKAFEEFNFPQNGKQEWRFPSGRTFRGVLPNNIC